MSWRNTLFDGPGFQVLADPPWLLAPLFVRDLHDLPVLGGADLPGPLTDALPQLTAGIQELSSARQARRAAGAGRAAADWPRWWASALDFRPGGPAPRQEDLVAHSPGLAGLWTQSESLFQGWLAGRAGTSQAGSFAEHRLLEALAENLGEQPAPRSLVVLVLPVSGTFFARADADRVVVSAELRADPAGYPRAVGPVLTEYFFPGRSAP